MKTLLAVAAILFLSACQNMAQFSPEYQAAHEKAFWANYRSGGVDAMAVANLKAHIEAERQVGK